MDVLISMLMQRYDKLNEQTKNLFVKNNYFMSLKQEISLTPGRYSPIQLNMIIDVFIEATKIWWVDLTIEKQLYLNYRVIINVFDPDLKIDKVSNWFYYQELKNRINKEILKDFIPNIDDKINQEIQIYVFKLDSLPLDVITSYDGKRIYINKDLKHPLTLIQIKQLEKAFVNCLYRHSNLDPLIILESKESRMNRSGELLDFGEYYLQKAYPSDKESFPWSFIVHRYKKMI